MVEISLSGSGEGPGWETSRPTLQGMPMVRHTDRRRARFPKSSLLLLHNPLAVQ
jgi:hypothetical protein